MRSEGDLEEITSEGDVVGKSAPNRASTPVRPEKKVETSAVEQNSLAVSPTVVQTGQNIVDITVEQNSLTVSPTAV